MPCIKTPQNRAQNLSLKKLPSWNGIRKIQIAAKRTATLLTLGIGIALFSGCASQREPVPTPTPAPIPVPAPAPVFTPIPPPPVAPPAASVPQLPMVASWADYRRRAAYMVIAANLPDTFTGPQPAQWTGIATITVMLNADGSIRVLDLMRGSRISPEVNDLALAAVRRTANFGPVTNLPEPWQFNETFLYNANNKFQLVTIVESR